MISHYLLIELSDKQIDHILFGLGVLVICLFGLYSYLNSPKRKLFQSLKKSPPKAIYNTKEGEYVRLHGTVLSNDDMLNAPLSGRTCIFYLVKVREKNGDNVDWTEEFNYRPFTIKVGNEFADIRPGSKGVINHYLDIDIISASRPHKFPKENIKKFLAKHKIKEHTWLFNTEKDIDFYEAVITPGERIAVKGIAKWKTDPKTKRRHLELHGTYDKPVLLSDDPKTLKILPKNK